MARRAITFALDRIHQEVTGGVFLYIHELCARHWPMLGTGHCRHGRQPDRAEEGIKRPASSTDIARRGNENQTANAGTLCRGQLTREPRGAEAAIALAEQVFGRNVTTETIKPETDRLRALGNIAVD